MSPVPSASLPLRHERRARWEKDARGQALLAAEPRLGRLVDLARQRLKAAEVWVFGSRARGDAHPDSDWDIFLVLPDDAPESSLDPEATWQLGRDAGLMADVVAARATEVHEAADTPNTLAYVLAREGVRVDA